MLRWWASLLLPGFQRLPQPPRKKALHLSRTLHRSGPRTVWHDRLPPCQDPSSIRLQIGASHRRRVCTGTARGIPCTGRLHHVCCHHHSSGHRPCSRAPCSHSKQMEQDTRPCSSSPAPVPSRHNRPLPHLRCHLWQDESSSAMQMPTGEAVSTPGDPLQATSSKPLAARWLGSHDDKLRPLSPQRKQSTWRLLMPLDKLSGSVSFSKTWDRARRSTTDPQRQQRRNPTVQEPRQS